ncbi:galactose oxidase [Backusella circina FSU 941]|nr:galactose oxidase [Backusella circina FSU 941]
MPLISDSPFCYVFDLENESWTMKPLKLVGISKINPQVTSAVAVGKKIYLVGGRYLKSYTLSNGMIEIDTDAFEIRIINDYTGTPPRARHEHSVDVINDRYLIVFGGLCYNSVGENDVFVYDIFDNRWFVPPIGGHLPHLRFGHASTTIGYNLYIHGGSQLDNDSSYIVYDDLYKLDCQTWEWYKYEHPEVEKYLRNQGTASQGNSPTRTHIISTTGDSPLDRFQAYMCSYGHKLIIFGGHSIREDENENEILCSYSLDEVSVFSTRRCAWTNIHSIDTSGCDSLTVSDMSAALQPFKSSGLSIYIFAGKKEAEMTRSASSWTDHSQSGSNKQFSSNSNSSSSYDSVHSPRSSQHQGSDLLNSVLLPSILETANSSESDDGNVSAGDANIGSTTIGDKENSKMNIDATECNDLIMESLDKMTMGNLEHKESDNIGNNEITEVSENSNITDVSTACIFYFF